MKKLIVLVALLVACAGLRASASLDFKEWELLAIQEGGRTKPIDTFAQETVVRITGGRGLQAFGRAWQPSEFLLSIFLDDTRHWSQQPIILLGYHPLAVKLGLDKDRHLFSLEELGHSTLLPQLIQEAHEAREARGADGMEGKPDRLHQEAESVAARMALLARLQSGNVYLIVPPPQDPHATWLLPPDFKSAYTEAQFDPAGKELQAMANAYVSQDELNFSAHAHALRQELRSLSPLYPSDSALTGERFYNHLRPFDWATGCYVLALFCIGLGLWLGRSGTVLPKIGLGIVGVGLLLHVTGIALRCWIGGRPPVTNMYESMVWVSSGVMIMAVLFFIRYRTFAYLLAALPVSATLLLMVGQFPLVLPTNIDPLVPVLRSNYWLTIHVLTITLSYAAFALAMALAHLILFRYLRAPAETAREATLHFWLYRVMQLGVLLLAAGTILGGVWANYSWGRFWGWDPKETWALITLLCYLVVLHGRIANWWRDFGLVIGCVICFLSVVMAWYGVNFILGTGLHSYGFGVGGESYVMGIVGADLLFVLLAVYRYRSLGKRGGSGHKILNEGLPETS